MQRCRLTKRFAKRFRVISPYHLCCIIICFILFLRWPRARCDSGCDEHAHGRIAFRLQRTRNGRLQMFLTQPTMVRPRSYDHCSTLEIIKEQGLIIFLHLHKILISLAKSSQRHLHESMSQQDFFIFIFYFLFFKSGTNFETCN